LVKAVTREQHEVDKKLTNTQPLKYRPHHPAAESPLVLAILNLDTVMVDTLISQRGADANQEILILGRKSTPLIFAIRCLAGRE